MATKNLTITNTPQGSEVKFTAGNGIANMAFVRYEYKDSHGRGRPSWKEHRRYFLTWELAANEAEIIRAAGEKYHRNVEVHNMTVYCA